MRSYTDLKQSQTIAEILPHDTADQTWERIIIAGANFGIPEEKQYRHNGDMPFNFYSGIGVPCWSLTALLGIIPDVSLNGFMDGKWNAMVQRDGKMIYVDKNNPIDACFELILKLYELKLL